MIKNTFFSNKIIIKEKRKRKHKDGERKDQKEKLKTKSYLGVAIYPDASVPINFLHTFV